MAYRMELCLGWNALLFQAMMLLFDSTLHVHYLVMKVYEYRRNVLMKFVMNVVVMMGGGWNWIKLMSSRGL
jgi:hypothetical protein